MNKLLIRSRSSLRSQVARQLLPKGAPCIGVDLASIKPIPKCVALVQDITTSKCRAAIKRELPGKDGKVDMVLHDGAPNVGGAWLQDAYGQNVTRANPNPNPHALTRTADALLSARVSPLRSSWCMPCAWRPSSWLLARRL